MKEALIDTLKSLRTSAAGAGNGYDEAIRDTGERGLKSLFRQMGSLHSSNARELAAVLRQAGENADANEMAVPQAAATILSLLGGQDESILPGLIDGESKMSQVIAARCIYPTSRRRSVACW
jgi:hypothetical protein